MYAPNSKKQPIKAKAVVTWFVSADSPDDEGVTIEFFDRDGGLLGSATCNAVKVVELNEYGIEEEFISFECVESDIDDPNGLLYELANIEGTHDVLLVEEEDNTGAYLALVKILN